MQKLLLGSIVKLKGYCEAEGFRGWDPYDGLNSRVFQALPWLKQSALCRLVVIQGFKRCPVNLRRLALVPKQYNAKGLGLAVQAYANLLKSVAAKPELAAELGSEEELRARLRELADLLLTLRSEGPYHGACWGYNFDWQARTVFLFPRFTPTVVATTFCATALLDAADVLGDKRLEEVALSAAEFVMHDLHRTPQASGGFLFSYSPLAGNDTVYNASLLGSKLLAQAYARTDKKEYLEAARESVKACCAAQGADGSWVYGMMPKQNWIDSFHTGYNLDALMAYQEQTGDTAFADNISRGLDYYLKNFFLPDGSPKYYNNRQYPIDIHCPGQLFVTLARLNCFSAHRDLAEKVLGWTISHMQAPKGYFYYQLKRGVNSRISYMRWSNAFMFNALSWYLLGERQSHKI